MTVLVRVSRVFPRLRMPRVSEGHLFLVVGAVFFALLIWVISSLPNPPLP